MEFYKSFAARDSFFCLETRNAKRENVSRETTQRKHVPASSGTRCKGLPSPSGGRETETGRGAERDTNRGPDTKHETKRATEHETKHTERNTRNATHE
jgi:hypothetical protein